MIFSVPMIKALKSGTVFAFLPPQFYKLTLEILVNTFEDNQVSFNNILSNLKTAFLNDNEMIE